MKKSSLVLVVVLVFAGLQAAEASKKNRVSDQARTLRASKNNITKGLNQIMSLNKSSSLLCKVDDDGELIENLLTCDSPTVIKPSCASESGSSGYTKRSNIASLKCSACDMTFDIIAKITEHTEDSKAADTTLFSNYYVDHPQSNVSIEAIKQRCLSYIQGKDFDYNEGESNSTLEEEIRNLTHIRDLVRLQEHAFVHVLGRHGEQVEVLGFPTVGECENEIEEYNEVVDYKTESEKEPVEAVASNDSLEKDTFRTIALKDSRNRNLPLKVSEFPSLRGAYSYKIQNQPDEQEKVEAAMNFHVDPTWVPLKDKADRKFKLQGEDLNNKVHHLVFDEKAPDINELSKYLNSTINQTRTSIVNADCDGKPEHLNITISVLDPAKVGPQSPLPKTNRYILECKNNGSRNKILSIRPIK